MSKWYREPLVHFTLIAIIIFLFMEGNTFEEKEYKKIVIDHEQIQELRQQWKFLQRREPTPEELNNTIEVYIKNEIFYQEALRLKLDQNDPEIRKVLIDKMYYVASDLIDISRVSESVFKKYFNQHKDKFIKNETSISFEHIYLNPQRHKELNFLAKKIWTKIHKYPYTKASGELGDKFYGGAVFVNANKNILSKIFSHAFVEELFTLEENNWSTPLKSGFGLHLIYVEKINKSIKSSYADVVEEVKRDWLIEEKNKRSQEFYNQLKKEYDIEW